MLWQKRASGKVKGKLHSLEDLESSEGTSGTLDCFLFGSSRTLFPKYLTTQPSETTLPRPLFGALPLHQFLPHCGEVLALPRPDLRDVLLAAQLWRHCAMQHSIVDEARRKRRKENKSLSATGRDAEVKIGEARFAPLSGSQRVEINNERRNAISTPIL